MADARDVAAHRARPLCGCGARVGGSRGSAGSVDSERRPRDTREQRGRLRSSSKYEALELGFRAEIEKKTDLHPGRLQVIQ